MVLLGVKKEDDWLKSSWQSTYGMNWDDILHAVSSLFDYFTHREILLDEKNVEKVLGKNDILKLEERSSIVIRGISTIMKVPMMIRFYNQSQTVDVFVQCATKEFEEADYQKFNMSLGQYMDSIELAMFCNREIVSPSGRKKIKAIVGKLFKV